MKLMMRKSFFTLVEVLIAMGICVVGVVAIMGLFPVGTSASRDAVMVGQAKDAATMILKFYKYCVENGGDTAFKSLTGWTIDSVNTYIEKTIPALTSDSTKEVGNLPYAEGDYVSINNTLGGTDISSLLEAAKCKVQLHKQLNDTPQSGTGVYLVKFVSNYSEDDGTDTEVDDTLSIVKTWVTPVTIPDGATIPRLVAFNVEVSWPAELPYEKRQREFYSIDVFCPVN